MRKRDGGNAPFAIDTPSRPPTVRLVCNHEKFPVLRKAVRSVTQSDSRGLLHVIDELRREDTPISRNIADHIDSFTDYDFAHLLFSDGTVENAISLDNQLNIIQVADLVLPDKDTTFEEYTTIELLSVSMLIVISTFALDFIPVSYTHLQPKK